MQTLDINTEVTQKSDIKVEQLSDDMEHILFMEEEKELILL